MIQKKKMIFKGTDIKAFNKARKKGGSPQQMSKNYYLEKRKNQKKQNTLSYFKKVKFNFISSPKRKKIVKVYKYIPKNTLLDVIREHRSPTIISKLSNSFSTVIVKTFNKQLTNNEKDIVRSSMALVISETLNKALQRPFEAIDNIKMFIKVGKAIYKVILKLNKLTKKYHLKTNSIYKVSETNNDYQIFLLQYPKLKEKYEVELCEDEILKCPICNSELLEQTENNNIYYVCENYINGRCTYISEE